MDRRALVIHQEDVIKHTVGAWCIVFYVFDNIESVNAKSAAWLRSLFGTACFTSEFSTLVFSNKEELYEWLRQNSLQLPFPVRMYTPEGKCFDEFAGCPRQEGDE